ncbi:MAG TPA: DUF6455 family protein [Burkholderiales bacterium]|nr:DUF6455 family protein [Burkholderiales bacterium]
MIPLDIPTVVLALVALASLIALFVLVADSRRLASAGADLLWAFQRRRGAGRNALVGRMGERAVRVAEMRCAQCSSRGDCLALLAEGASAPPADCPNGSFFQKGS